MKNLNAYTVRSAKDIEKDLIAGAVQSFLSEGYLLSEINISRECAIHPHDVRNLIGVSLKDFLVVIRCPKPSSWLLQGKYPPKSFAVKQKSSDVGLVRKGGVVYVSDYDLMSVWKRSGANGYVKIFISAADGLLRGRYSDEATQFLLEANKGALQRFQHGCQDDFAPTRDVKLNPGKVRNQGVGQSDHFAAFINGAVAHLSDRVECQKFYHTHGLLWPYDAEGKYMVAKW